MEAKCQCPLAQAIKLNLKQKLAVFLSLIHHHKLLRIAKFIFFRQRTGKICGFFYGFLSIHSSNFHKITNCLIYIWRTYCSRYSYTANKNQYRYIWEGEFQGNTCFNFYRKESQNHSISFICLRILFELWVQRVELITVSYGSLLTLVQARHVYASFIHSLLSSPYPIPIHGQTLKCIFICKLLCALNFYLATLKVICCFLQ